MKISVSARRSASLEGEGPVAKRGSGAAIALVVSAIILVAAFVFLLPYVPAALKAGSEIISRLASGNPGSSHTVTMSSSVSTSGTITPLDTPLIQGGSANVTFPSDYDSLAAYALNLINQDRANSSLGPVVLSDNTAGQQHVDSMLYYGYFSHFDTQGLKPYMRYSLLGGVGADFENIAYIFNSPPHFTTTSSVEDAIKILEHSMMYDDKACCNNGHRENILNPLHNKVSIGIAYNGTSVYFAEEFENDYINLDFSISNAYYVTMTGTSLQPAVTSKVDSLYVSFDVTPSPATPDELNKGPHEYGPGTLIGGVLPRSGLLGCGRFQEGTTVCADSWKFTSSQVEVSFSLQDFIQAHGSGVYTILLITGADTNSAITTISIFV